MNKIMGTIKATELRFGNLIHSNSSNCIFNKGIVEVDFDIFKKIQLYNALENLEPIPLTEEWLLKFGFGIKEPILTSVWKFSNIGETIITKCEYVHQLQNLYFALTGEELTIKNPT